MPYIFIKFYTKPKHFLFDEARILLNHSRKDYPFDVEEINILDAPTFISVTDMKFLSSHSPTCLSCEEE